MMCMASKYILILALAILVEGNIINNCAFLKKNETTSLDEMFGYVLALAPILFFIRIA